MKYPRWIVWLVLILVCACSQAPVVTPTPTKNISTLAPITASTTRVPDVQAKARAYLEAWKADDYTAMYALLTSVSQDALPKDEFIKHYQSIGAEMALSGVDFDIQSALVDPDIAQVNYQVTLHSAIVGDIQRSTVMNLRLEVGEWRVEWNDTMILPELVDGDTLAMDLDVPARANIYDRNGHAIVAQSDAVAIGIYPDNIDPDQADALFGWLVRLSGLRSDTIQGLLENFPPGGGWYLPLGEVPSDVSREKPGCAFRFQRAGVKAVYFSLLFRRRHCPACDRLCQPDSG